MSAANVFATKPETDSIKIVYCYRHVCMTGGRNLWSEIQYAQRAHVQTYTRSHTQHADDVRTNTFTLNMKTNA